ncbi:MAG: phenylalanine--tRNA ligase subunit beta, partial [Candidatus Melainabacteria bacterium]|nr:phenylalanine--tRNA ligase subunit beta [Candidatus Melainabacteria bacterium]
RLVVRRASPGEQLVTIDGRKRHLSEEVLVIADEASPVGIAGIMGGKDSEVADDTTSVGLEAAAFQPHRVRRASRHLGIASDSSIRFERAVDIGAVRRASDRAAYLILQTCGGHLGKMTIAGSDQTKPQTVSLRLGQIKRLLDVDLTGKQISELLTPLGFSVNSMQQELLNVTIPSFRFKDVTREIDLIEEVCRLYGYERIVPTMPQSTVAPELADSTELVTRQALSACGLNETWLSSLTGLSLNEESSSVRVLNPLSQEHQALRQSLLPGLIQAVVYNQDRGRADVWLYEIGRVYQATGQSSSKYSGAVEELRVAGAISGQRQQGLWHASEGPEVADFYILKGVVENLLAKLGLVLEQVSFEICPASPMLFHPGRCCQISYSEHTGFNILGWLGELSPQTASQMNVRQTVHAFEICLDTIRKLRRTFPFREIYTTPELIRDLTVDLPATVAFSTTHSLIKASAGPYLRGIELVSVYPLQQGWQSFSCRLTFQHPDKTFTNEQIEEFLSTIRSQLASKLGGLFR